MKNCYNCKSLNREGDVFCRNCGLLMRSHKYYIFINIGTIIAIFILLFVIVLFIASYFIH